MAEAFKHLLNEDLVRLAGAHLSRASGDFPRARFESLALHELAGMEMKRRALHIASALEATLPEDFSSAAALIERSLAPPGQGDDLSQLRAGDDGLAGWIVWPLGEYVARRGIDEPARALRTLHALTQRFSAEFAIRPFIARHPALCFETLTRWCGDPSAHVRRLVSEGSRPRLPWGMQLRALIADPSPTLPLLEALLDDPSAYVRRSVANHLNDIAKDHPDLVARWVSERRAGASVTRDATLRHASRTLIKRGHPGALAAWGLGRSLRGTASLRLDRDRAAVGEEVTLTLTLRSAADHPQPLEVDYAVHHVKARGHSAPRVFKGWRLTLAAGETRTLVRRHSLRAVSTRRYHPGRHAVDVRVNGEVVAEGAFTLR